MKTGRRNDAAAPFALGAVEEVDLARVQVVIGTDDFHPSCAERIGYDRIGGLAKTANDISDIHVHRMVEQIAARRAAVIERGKQQ